MGDIHDWAPPVCGSGTDRTREESNSDDQVDGGFEHDEGREMCLVVREAKQQGSQYQCKSDG